MDNLKRDFRLALRRIKAAPGVAVFSIVTLALGIGVATGAYSIVYTGLWQPLGIVDEDRAVVVSRTNMMRPGPADVTWSDFQYLEKKQTSLSSLGVWMTVGSVLAADGSAELVSYELVSGGYFAATGIDAALGRLLNADDDRSDAKPVVVLSHTTWRDQFKSDKAVVGRTVKLADQPFEVVGVAAKGFRGVTPQPFAAKAGWVPLALISRVLTDSRAHALEPGGERTGWFRVLGRLKPGVSQKSAADDLAAAGAARDIDAPRPPYRASPTAALVPVNRLWTAVGVREGEQLSRDGNEMGRLIVVLPGLILLIACTNLANLVLSRGVSRKHDFAVRRALGASRWRLIREQLVEQGIIAVLGGIAGLVVANGLVTYCANIARTTLAPFTQGARVDWSFDAGVLQATAVAVLLSLVVFGLLPALHLTRDSLRTTLDQGSAITTPRWRGRGNLIALQVGVSVGFFLIAVVFIRIMLTELDRPQFMATPGQERISIAQIPFGPQHRSETKARETLASIIADKELAATHDAVGVTSDLPYRFAQMGGSPNGIGWIASESHPFSPKGRDAGRYVFAISATPGAITILSELRFGRMFDERDAETAGPVAIVNEGLALDMFGVADATGRELLMRHDDRMIERPADRKFEDLPTDRLTIVGVVAGKELGGGRSSQLHQLVMYRPLAQAYAPTIAVIARAKTGQASPALLRDAIKRADPELAVAALARADVLMEGPFAFAPYVAGLLTSLAFLSLGLAMAGLYGVLSHVVARRTRELGIRIALGAEPRRIAKLVLKDGFRPILEGLFIGIATAMVIRYFMGRTMFTKLAMVDPFAFGLAAVLLAVAGGIACYLPARRASRIDPNKALRSL